MKEKTNAVPSLDTGIAAVPRFWAENLIPMLLSASVVSSTAYVYACGSGAAAILFALISGLYSLLLFTIYEKLRGIGKTWISTIAIIILLFAVQAISTRLIDTRGFNDLGLWFMEPSRFTVIHYGNTFALIGLMGFLLISCLYYFTRVRYRGVFVFLICLCPFCLFAKTFTDIPVIFPIIIMTLFFFIMTANTASAGIRLDAGRGALMSALAFVLAVTVIASFFPKAENAPYREQFDAFITGVSIGAAGAADFTDFADSSSNTTAGDDDEVVFCFYGENPEYVKRQCFNMYNLEGNTWSYYGDSDTGSSGWRRTVAYEDPGSLYEPAGFSGGTVTKRQTWVRSESGVVRALYTPENIGELTLYNSDQKIYRTELDEYFVQNEGTDRVGAYAVDWFDFSIEPEFEKLFTDEYAGQLSDEYSQVSAYLDAKKQAEQYNDVLLSDRMKSGCYSSSDAREQVKELAESITEGFDTVYEKASAIEAYFRSGEYIYDDEYTSSDGSPDHFILRTKRGACAAYATAMTLMCRELGMTARYCEGFLIQQFNDQQNFWYVTAGDSHAFVQVWIDGYGWTDFDPTSTVTDGGYFDMTFIYVGAVAASAVLIGMLVMLLRPVFAERSFVRRMTAARGTAQYSMIYRRINETINRYTGSRSNKLTPTDTAARCAEIFGCDITGFVQEYENAVYGGYADENADNSRIYHDFTAEYKQKLREERKNKKK